MSVLRAFAVVLLSAAFLLVYGPPMLQAYTTAYTGFHPGPLGTLPTQAKTVVDAGSPAYRAGIRTGDTVDCTVMRDGTILYPSFEGAGYESTPIHACIVRGERVRSVSFVAQPGPPAESTYGTFGFAALRLFIFAVFLTIGSILVLVRPGVMTCLFFVYCLGTVPGAAATDALTVLPPLTYWAVTTIGAILSVFLGSACLLLFALLVPDEEPRGWRLWLYRVAGMVTLVFTAVLLLRSQTAQTGGELLFDPVARVASRILTFAVILVVVVRLITMHREARARFAWVAFGIVFGVVANYLRLEFNSTVASVGGVITVVMPITLMYAILRRHVIDVRFVISRAVVFGIITTAVIGVIAAVDRATSEYLSQMRVALAIDALITIALGVALHRGYGIIENAVDFYLFRAKHDAEIYLKRLARTLLSSEREQTIDHALVADPYEKLDLTMAALFRHDGEVYRPQSAAGWNVVHSLTFDHDHDLVRFLVTERSRVEIRNLGNRIAADFLECGSVPVVAMPVFDGNDLFGFTLYGLHRDGTKLDPDEIETLQLLCETAAQAYIRVENLRYRRRGAVAVR